MESILQTSISQSVANSTQRLSVWNKFITWATAQEHNRFMWLAIAVAGHGCVLTPITLLINGAAGTSFIWWPVAIGAMAMSLITNLAAMPTKITIPVFLFSVILDLVIIVNALAMLVNS